MKEEDRTKVNEALQEIETDLVFYAIESYERQQLDEFAEAIEALRVFLDVAKRYEPREESLHPR